MGETEKNEIYCSIDNNEETEKIFEGKKMIIGVLSMLLSQKQSFN